MPPHDETETIDVDRATENQNQGTALLSEGKVEEAVARFKKRSTESGGRGTRGTTTPWRWPGREIERGRVVSIWRLCGFIPTTPKPATSWQSPGGGRKACGGLSNSSGLHWKISPELATAH